MNIEIKKNNIEKKNIKNLISNNFWLRMFGEFLTSFVFIFTINFVVSLGELEIPFFKQITNINLTIAIWISTITLLSFLWMKRTSFSANFINLVMLYKNNEISSNEFYSIIPFQFLGGIIAAFFIYFFLALISYNYKLHEFNDEFINLQIMGGTAPMMKGLLTSRSLITSKPLIDFFHQEPSIFSYFYSSIQGIINSILIISFFVFNSIIDKKYDNDKSRLFFRYIILIVGISITTVFYSNTTNWVRLLSPAIILTIRDMSHGIYYGASTGLFMLTTTITYICFQMIGILFILKSK